MSVLATMLSVAIGAGFATAIFIPLVVLVTEYVDEWKADRAYRKRKAS